MHLIASSSHRNVAALWDAKKSRTFNWAWAEAPTGATYANEAMDSVHELLSCLYDSAQSTEGRSAQIVLDALTSNARKVFKLLLGFQLDNPRSPGLAFSDLYKRARAAFATTNETALRKHIAEFTDHHLVRTRTGMGGQQCYFCSLPQDAMRVIFDKC